MQLESKWWNLLDDLTPHFLASCCVSVIIPTASYLRKTIEKQKPWTIIFVMKRLTIRLSFDSRFPDTHFLIE